MRAAVVLLVDRGRDELRRRPGGGAAALAARTDHRRELLLRHGRPVRERRHRQRPRRAAAGDRRASRASIPTGKGWYHGGDLKGLTSSSTTSAVSASTRSGSRRASRTAPCSAGQQPRRLPRLLDHGLHPDRPAPRHATQDLADLIAAAHRRGMKVYFDIITNHTADVIGYEGSQPRRTSARTRPRTRRASGTPFDDRDYAGELPSFPALVTPLTSFPPGYAPSTPSDITRSRPGSTTRVYYHNRGDTTFYGEDSLYGDFFGLDDLFTEHPDVVDGHDRHLQDVDPRLRHRRLPDRHDEARQRRVLAEVRAGGARVRARPGQVASSSCSARWSTRSPSPTPSRFTTTTRCSPCWTSRSSSGARLRRGSHRRRPAGDFFEDDDWYTDADSNAYQLPTFLGNHDMGRIGMFIRQDNAGADDAEVLQRDKLAHELMYFSRGNPVIYYGDEQGFVGDGGDQGARQDMFPSQVAVLQRRRPDRDGRHDGRTRTSTPGIRSIRAIGGSPRSPAGTPALRNGALQHRYAAEGAGIYAFSRMQRRTQREYVVAFNNSESAQTAAIPTYMSRGQLVQRLRRGRRRLRTNADSELSVTVPALSAVVYKLAGRVPRSRRAPSISLDAPAVAAAQRERVEVGADVGGDSFAEVTFQAEAATAAGRRSAPTTTRPTASSTTSPACGRGPRCATAPSCSTTPATRAGAAGAPRPSRRRCCSGTRGSRPRAPTCAHRVRRDLFAGSRAGDARGALRAQRRRRGVDDRRHGLVVAAVLGLATTRRALPVGTEIRYRAVLTDLRLATSTSEIRTVTIVGAGHHGDRALQPAGGDYADWGLHLWGDAVADSVLAQVDVGQAVAADGRRRVRRVLRDRHRGRHQAGELHHAPPADSVPDDARARRRPLVRAAATAPRSGSSRATRRSTRPPPG